MLSKTRTTIISLVAAIGFSGAAIVPTVAQADTKQTTGKQQAEKNCEADFKGFEASVNRMEQTQKEGNAAGFNDAKVTAENFLTLYESAGCDTIAGTDGRHFRRRIDGVERRRCVATRARARTGTHRRNGRSRHGP